MVVVAMGVIGVAGSEGELAEEVVRLRGRVFVQFGACGCAWCDDEELGGDGALLLGACDGEVVGVVVADSGKNRTIRTDSGSGQNRQCAVRDCIRILLASVLVVGCWLLGPLT